MSVVEQVRRDRKDLSRVLKEYPGIRRLVEDLYPDSAHFIYELLQNAEDTEASEVSFTLFKEQLVFEHNGRAFNEADIHAITTIGEGTNSDDDDKIGRFGIGFKAVFAYTDTPRIWSPNFAFEISDMVLPAELALNPSLGDRTRFEFPFDSSKKPAADAFSEVKAGLEELSADTLLFLSHIESIDWRVEGKTQARLLRISHFEHHLETRWDSGEGATRSYFLRFTQPVERLKNRYAAIAFELDPLPGGNSSSANSPLAKRFRITPAKRGRVAVYFTCANETSGLRFHLHAPFVPEPSRASVKETPANEPLFQQLATLAADSLPTVRNLGLLDREFLAVLPNQNDGIHKRYTCVREAIVRAMNEQPLTPTHSGGHAPAEHLLRARAALKDLLNTEDIAVLHDSEGARNDWAVSATQQYNAVDRFLWSLDIEEWDVEQLVEALEERLDADPPFDGAGNELLEWLRSKSGGWHQALYALLYRVSENKGLSIEYLGIVLLSTGEYRVGSECYFPTDEVQEDSDFPRVARHTYTSGGSKAEQAEAKSFLDAVGVREVTERGQVEVILKRRYSDKAAVPGERIHEKDLRRFIALVKDDPQTATIFWNHRIFRCEGDIWVPPGQAYLDSPYLETGLRAFFGTLNDNEEDKRPVAVADHYLKYGISKEELVVFAKATGVQSKLVSERQLIWRHPNIGRILMDYPGTRTTHTFINSDWMIPNLELALKRSSENISRLIWNTMMKAQGEVLVAKYRPNQRYPTKTEPSTLVLTLRKLPWIPQGNGEFVPPAKASRELLPSGFAFDQGWPWLKAIGFGEGSARRDEERHRRRVEYRKLGFENDEAFEDGKRFAKLDPNTRRRILAEQETPANLPDQRPGNPTRRAERVRQEAKNAPGRDTSIRNRSVSEHRETVKEKAEPYLREQYTDRDDVMICQVCKTALPFRLDDGNYYFEAVEFLPMLERRHYQNYLALCPNHAAMYMHANGSKEAMRELFLALDGNKLEVDLANEDNTIYFTGTHIADLEAVIEAESSDQ